jgi:hypothetical protein
MQDAKVNHIVVDHDIWKRIILVFWFLSR